MKNDWFDVVLSGLCYLIQFGIFVGAIWFWAWLADYRIGCMFDSSPRACANLAKMSEERIKNE
jgi:hypothetical protein